MEIDAKVIFSGLSFVISVVSLFMAVSAKKEAKETALLDLVHKKRILLSDNFSEVCRVVRLLKDENFENQKLSESYARLRKYRDEMIEQMNDSYEMVVDIKSLDKKLLLNQISDFNLLKSIYSSDLIDFQIYMESGLANKSMQPIANASAD
jgi:hypothetical protein